MFLTKLHQKLTRIALEEAVLLYEINEKIQKLLMFVEEASYIDLQFNEAITAADIIKISNFTIREDQFSTIDKITDFLDCIMELCQPKLVVLVNTLSYLADYERNIFLADLSRKKIPVFCIEKHLELKGRIELEQEIVYTLDKDLCVF